MQVFSEPHPQSTDRFEGGVTTHHSHSSCFQSVDPASCHMFASHVVLSATFVRLMRPRFGSRTLKTSHHHVCLDRRETGLLFVTLRHGSGAGSLFQESVPRVGQAQQEQTFLDEKVGG